MNLSGSPFDFLIAFGGGVLASLTPCVYPLIPVSAGYIVGNAEGLKARAFFLSLFYVIGMSLTYSILGILAVMTGTIFGRFSTSPITGLASGIFIFICGIAMLDLFKIHHLVPKVNLSVSHNGGYFSALLFGAVSGLMLSPCLVPILGSILAYLATRDNLFYGAFLLFCFSFGMGLIFIVVGTFGGELASLPKGGRWMIAIKKACAVILILAGLYFIFSSLRRF